MPADEVGLGKIAHNCVVSGRDRAHRSRVVATAAAGPSRSQFPVSVRACPSRALAITSQRGTVRAGSLNSFDVQVEPLPEPENAPLFHEAFSTSLCCHLRSDPLIATITVVWGSGEIRREAQSPSK